MKFFVSLCLTFACLLGMAAEEGDAAAEPKAEMTEAEKVGYAIGMQMAMQIQQMVEMGGLTEDDINIQAVVNAIQDGLTGELAMTNEEAMASLQAFSQKMQQRMQDQQEAAGGPDGAPDAAAGGADGTAEGQAYLKENAKKEGVTVTDSGLQYEVIEKGKGEKPAATDTVKVHYEGTFVDGEVFDSSIQRDEPVEFPLNRVIAGWTEGLQLMNVGSTYRFVVPSDLAYGKQGRPPQIPPNSTLVFKVELLDIVDNGQGQ